MKPSFDQLQAFVALADTSHFTRAAERLGVSQSSLSGTVRKLEDVLGVRLFDRHTRGCALSAAGAALLPASRRLLVDWGGLLDDARDFASFGRGRLVVAAPGVQCALLLPPLLRRFAEERPGVRVSLHDVAEEQVHEQVRSGEADLGISTDAGERSDLVLTPFHADQYVVAMAPDHALARRRNVEWAHLAEEPIIGPLPDNPVRRLLDARLAAVGVRLNYRHEVSLAWTMVGLAREGLGITVLTTAVRPLAEWHQLTVRPVSRPTLSRSLALIRAPGRPLSPPAAALRDLLMGTQASRSRR